MSNFKCFLVVAFISRFIFSSVLFEFQNSLQWAHITFAIKKNHYLYEKKTFLQATSVEQGSTIPAAITLYFQSDFFWEENL